MLLIVAAVNLLAQLAVQLVVLTWSSKTRAVGEVTKQIIRKLILVSLGLIKNKRIAFTADIATFHPSTVAWKRIIFYRIE